MVCMVQISFFFVPTLVSCSWKLPFLPDKLSSWGSCSGMGMSGLLWQVQNDSGAVCLVMLHGIPSSQYVSYGLFCLLTLLHPPFS